MQPLMLRRALSGTALMAFDFDGSLAPIVEQPELARMRPSTRRLLIRLAQTCPTVVLTGRDRSDAARRLRGVPLRLIVGNHGLELGGDAAAPTIEAWAEQLRERIREPDVFIEHKRLSIAAHYRAAQNQIGAHADVMEAVRYLSPAPRVLEGKACVNLIPDIGLDKGTALRRMMKAFDADSGMYLGDDATDEPAFVAANELGLLTIKVGLAEHSAARFVMPMQQQVDALLFQLLEVTRHPQAPLPTAS